MPYPTKRIRIRKKFGNKRRVLIRPKKRTMSASASSGVNSSSTMASRIFPPVKNVKFTYVSDKTLLAAVGDTDGDTYRVNSLFDPDAAIGGLQPRYYDTLLGATGTTAPYQRYTVLAAKVESWVRNLSANFMYVSLTMCNNQITPPSTIVEARERQDTILRLVPPLGSGSPTGKLMMYRRIKDMFGVADVKDNADLKAYYNASPVQSAVAVIIAYNMDGTVSNRMNHNTRITFYSQLSIVNDVADS